MPNDELKMQKPWEMHIQDDDQARAIAAAQQTLATLDHQNFTNTAEAPEFAKSTRDVMVLSEALAKKEPTWDEAGPAMQLATQTAADYPMAKTQEEAQRRLEFWRAGLPPDEALYVCLRDLYQLADMVIQILPKGSQETTGEFDDILLWARAILTLGEQLALMPPEVNEITASHRAALMQVIEASPHYLHAVRAYNKFVELFGPKSGRMTSDEMITISTRMFGRAVDHGDILTALFCRKNWRAAVESDPTRVGLSRRDVLKNMSATVKKLFLARRYRQWRAEAVRDEVFISNLRKLTKMMFLGLSDIHTGESVKEERPNFAEIWRQKK